MPSEITPTTPEHLPRAAKQRAARAIENVHLAYYEKGGIRDLEDTLHERRGAAARHIFALAQYASENSADLDEAIALFLGMCAYAEAKYKRDQDATNLKDTLPTWAVFKSNILRGIREYELDPIDHRSEGAFRVAMQKAEQQALAPPATNGAAAIERALSPVRYDPVRSLLVQIIHECEAIKRSKHKDAEAILRETMDRLQPFIDHRKAP